MEEEDINNHYNNQLKREHRVDSLIDILHRVHIDNARQQYFAQQVSGRQSSIMPLTPFVFEYFIFNSLYQVDWLKSFELEQLTFHPEEYKELKQQNEFTKFIKYKSRRNPGNIYRAFLPLSFLLPIEGDWTEVTPDARITIERGLSFFKKIRKLQDIILATAKPEEMPTTKAVFELIDGCKDYIYLVRNNVFHGSKTLGEVSEPNQKSRIEVYDLFLKGLTSLFFLSVGEGSVASDFVQLPITNEALPSRNRTVLDINKVWSAIKMKLIGPRDSRLISMFNRLFKPPGSEPKSALFYPSAGIDMITPILLGLPYCKEFYFYELRPLPRFYDLLSPIFNFLRRTEGFRCEQCDWHEENDEHFLSFKFNGIQRNVHWVHRDNKDFLDRDVNLTFYFHRGDSWGEGGSGQQWDSKLLPQLIKKIPKGIQCIYLTDGEPGGISSVIEGSAQRLQVPYGEMGPTYYCGHLPQMAKLT